MSEHEWHSNDVEYAMKHLNTSMEGISSSEAQTRLETHGYNELVALDRISPLRMFLRQFTDPMVIILLVAIVISVFTSMFGGEGGHGFIDAIVISAIVIFNSVFGFVQEYKSEQALEALKEMAAPRALVMRDGLWIDIDSKELIPGDIVALESGARVPADGRVVYAVGFGVDEAVLTGESMAVRKVDDPIHLRNPVIADMINMVFSGTTIVSGKGRAVVTATGMNTEFGKIAEMVQESEKDMTPLQHDLEDLGKKLGILVIILVLIVFAAEVLRNVGSLMEELLTAIALAVSAIPEGLPAVVTITLAIGVQRMVQRNAIVRRLPSVETLGSTTIIASDKTGTITKNEMTVTNFFVNGMTIDVTGVGYNKDGQFFQADKEFDVHQDPHVIKLIEIGQLCSNALLQEDQSGAGDWTIVGDPTEGALLVVAEKAGVSYDKTWNTYTEITEISFDSVRKRMTSICKGPEENLTAFSKGAPETLLSLCSRIYENGTVRPLDKTERENILEVAAGFADKALRILAFAYRDLDHEIPDWDAEEVEKDLVFVGLQGMIDPPRDEVLEAMATCVKAGIRPIMITGDHELTARAIAREVGLIERGGQVITGAMIDDMTDEEFDAIVDTCSVYARVAPEHKLRIVEALKAHDQVVAMTGDGVNILVDDNFATIVSAVEKGREIYSNIRKFVRFLLAANFDELFLIFTIIMIGLPLPITAIQILWLNLATDGFPALALGVDPPEKGVMNRPPRKPGKKMMDRGMMSFILVAGFVAFLASATAFFWSLTVYGGWIPGLTGPLVNWTTDVSSVTGLTWDYVLTHARTTVFASVVFFELLFVWNCRDEYHPVWKTDITGSKALMIAVLFSFVLTLVTIYVPFVAVLFQCVPLNPLDWAVIALTCIPALLVPPHILFGHHKEEKLAAAAEANT
jgi:Ca2+-transporting ATPase